jgi:hypothetical protein
MKKATYDKASRGNTLIKVLGITMLAFLILENIAGTTQDSDSWFNKGVSLVKLDHRMKQ